MAARRSSDPTSTDCHASTPLTCFASMHSISPTRRTARRSAMPQATLPLTRRRSATRSSTSSCGSVHRADLRRRRRDTSRRTGASGGPKLLSATGLLLRHQRRRHRRLPRRGAAVHADVFHALRRLERGKPCRRPDGAPRRPARAVARGQALFNTKPIAISGVKGLNDDLGVPVHPRHLHDLPRHAERRQPLDPGAARHRPHRRRRAARPTCRSTRCATRRTGETVQTTDPGPRAHHRQVEGHRPLQGTDPARPGGARAVLPQRLGGGPGEPWSTSTTRFGIGLTDQEKSDLVAFLRAL